MYKYRPFYQLVFFVNHNVAPSPDILSSLLSGYGGFTPCPVNAGTVLLRKKTESPLKGLSVCTGEKNIFRVRQALLRAEDTCRLRRC
jgi:hypothetical protein